jgi:hypothetical protein
MANCFSLTMASQAAEKHMPGTKTRQGTTSQLAEKLIRAVGRGFIPDIKASKINVGL